MTENQNELKEYVVAFENAEGVLYTQSVMGINKRHAILSAINNNKNEKNISIEDFTPIDAKPLAEFNQVHIHSDSLKEVKW